MTDYLSPALALFALGWALRLEAKQSATATKQADVAEALDDIKGSVKTVDGKVDQLIMRLIPQAVDPRGGA